MNLLWVAVAMVFKDGLGTLLVVAEAKGRGLLAGALDAASDVAQVFVTIFGAVSVAHLGWCLESVMILAVMCMTSFAGTMGFTELGQRITTDKEAK